jgi:hypothetical protein
MVRKGSLPGFAIQGCNPAEGLLTGVKPVEKEAEFVGGIILRHQNAVALVEPPSTWGQPVVGRTVFVRFAPKQFHQDKIAARLLGWLGR